MVKKRKTQSKSSARTISRDGLCAATGEMRRQIVTLIGNGVIPKCAKRGEYPWPDANIAVVKYYKDQASKVSDAKAEAARRQGEAEAELAELELAEKRKSLLPAKAVIQVWEDAAVQVRQIVMGSKIAESEKKAILDRVCKIKVKPPKIEIN